MSVTTSASGLRFYGQFDDIFEVRLHEPDGFDRMPESVIQDLWQRLQFRQEGLQTSDGESVVVVHPGTHNHDSGPDFSRAHVRIGGMDWHGDVEIHRTSYDWIVHGHQTDPRYDRVVLHVTLFQDAWTGNLMRQDGVVLPELVLQPYLAETPRSLLYAFYSRDSTDFPCAAHWRGVPGGVRHAWIAQMGTERLQAKAGRMADAYLEQPSMETLLYRHLFAALGFSKNTRAMHELACRIPLSLARRFQTAFELEALLFGTAGLIPARKELLASDRETADYVEALRGCFEGLQASLLLEPMQAQHWQFFRLRPANFPTVRIAQAAALLLPGAFLHLDPVGLLLHLFEEKSPLDALRERLTVTPSPFWRRHVRLEKASTSRSASLGRERVDIILTNVVAPLLLFYAEQQEQAWLAERVLAFCRELPAVADEVTRRFSRHGTRARNALEAQGLHQLYGTRCVRLGCLDCAVGTYLLRG